MKSSSDFEDDSLLSIIRLFKLIINRNESNLAKQLTDTRKLLSTAQDIFSTSTNAKVFAYLSEHGATTAWILQVKLGMPEATVYRVLKFFRAKRYITPAIKPHKRKGSKGGPRATVWALQSASNEQIAAAVRLHYRCLSPKYRVAEEVAQTILTDYIQKRQLPEITYRQIIITVKELQIPFAHNDIADLAASYLHEKGVKVWR